MTAYLALLAGAEVVPLLAGLALIVVGWLGRTPGTRLSDLLGLSDPPEDDECPPTP